jgi:hypothetical protein
MSVDTVARVIAVEQTESNIIVRVDGIETYTE